MTPEELRDAMDKAFNLPHELFNRREVVNGEVTNPLGLNSWPIKEDEECGHMSK